MRIAAELQLTYRLSSLFWYQKWGGPFPAWSTSTCPTLC